MCLSQFGLPQLPSCGPLRRPSRTGYAPSQAVSSLRTAAALRGRDMAALEQRSPSPCARSLYLDRITSCSRGGLRIDTVRDALAQRGAGLADEFRPNCNNGLDRRHIAHVLETFEDAAADGQVPQARRPGQGARGDQRPAGVCAHAGHDPEPAARRVLSQAVAGRARMPPPSEYPAQALMTLCLIPPCRPAPKWVYINRPAPRAP